MVTSLTNHHLPFVPGMETYFASAPIELYESANHLLEKISRPAASLPQVIVMDLSQSADAGLSVLRELKANVRTRSVPVLMRRFSTGPATYSTLLRTSSALQIQKAAAIRDHTADSYAGSFDTQRRLTPKPVLT